MNLFGILAKQLVKREKRVLGRWAIESCEKKTNTKIDMSNEDHCGPCGLSPAVPSRLAGDEDGPRSPPSKN
ncbi:hypothetical protein EB093_09085 [bacterium]|nr:hypothetical protein [bacterium]